MLKNFLSIILLVVFANFIVVPTIVSLTDSNADVSLIFNFGEEEVKESFEVQEIELSNNNEKEFIGCTLGKESTFRHFLKNYDSLGIQLLLPPPEQRTI